MKILATLVILGCPQLALAENSVFGMWCSGDGDLVHINVEYLANGDQIICKFDKALQNTDSFDSAAICRSWDFDKDGKPVLGFELPNQLEGWLVDKDHLLIDFGPDYDSTNFVRCD